MKAVQLPSCFLVTLTLGTQTRVVRKSKQPVERPTWRGTETPIPQPWLSSEMTARAILKAGPPGPCQGLLVTLDGARMN
jgi:hypothetical protein